MNNLINKAENYARKLLGKTPDEKTVLLTAKYGAVLDVKILEKIAQTF
jgi:actin-like ATPase involved in cell morphogenesis